MCVVVRVYLHACPVQSVCVVLEGVEEEAALGVGGAVG